MIGPFRGKYRFLSNFWSCSVLYEGITYPSAEHAYQAAKTIDPQQRLLISQNCPTPGDAKRMGRTLTLRKDWDTMKLLVMKNVVRCKFTQNQTLRNKLILTGSEELIEVNTWRDIFWGIYQGKGQNHLGKLLMLVRSELQKVRNYHDNLSHRKS
ncbi:hypothetical protein LCGC14_0429780 [marine sediment metagenome]|uniref:NADAR domain-containing protein n=1 Tax=marine sediment metagenome TaxID=412755 RepID=A0A0F9T6J7_9ZZZZ